MLLKDTQLNKRTISALEKRKITTTGQLCQFFPKFYRDYRSVVRFQDAVCGRHVAVRGKICAVKLDGNMRFIRISVLQESDETWLNCVMFQNIYKYDQFLKMRGETVIIGGEITLNEYGYSICNPDFIIEEEDFSPFIESVYTKFKGIAEDTMKSAIMSCVNDVTEEVLEEEICRDGKVIDYPTALKYVHQPENETQLKMGRTRILFNDLLYFAIALKLGDNGGNPNTDCRLEKVSLTSRFTHSLPFELTPDQKAVLKKVITTTQQGKRANILLQGDVGCGKTIVAAALMVCAAENGYQSVLMAPRSVLAKQHYDEVKKYAESCGLNAVFLHSGMKAKEKKEAYAGIKSGKYHFVIGTHSCLVDGLEYQNLGLIVTDEEHLFGVKQKEALVKKANDGVNSISMSATPIPRSLALVLYGEYKEICSIKTMPNGRKPIITSHEESHMAAFPFMEEEIRKGHQCYVVCPAIEESESDKVDLVAIETIEMDYRQYFEKRGMKVGIVNGKMKDTDISDMIGKFQRNEVQILISTTVIEVGVNVPNATVMVVEQADRFGLASLHQLRGRVGRSDLQSYCILVSEKKNNERIDVMVATTDGFKIAEADLRQRGSGNLIGVEQAGLNQLVGKMMEFPTYFSDVIRPLAEKCVKNGYGKGLMDLYAEGD